MSEPYTGPLHNHAVRAHTPFGYRPPQSPLQSPMAAPRQLPQTAFAEMCTWHCHALRTQHSHIRDALSGRSLDVLEQCVAIEVESSGEHELTGIGDALGSLKCDCGPQLEKALRATGASKVTNQHVSGDRVRDARGRGPAACEIAV